MEVIRTAGDWAHGSCSNWPEQGFICVDGGVPRGLVEGHVVL